MFGIHVRKGDRDDLYDAIIEDIDKLDINVAQIFTHGPQNRSKNNIKFDEVAKLNIPIYVHATYLSSIWDMKDAALGHVYDQLKVCAQIRAEGFVIHLRKSHIPDVIKVVKELIKNSQGQKIILEAPAMLSSPLSYESPERINELILEISKFATPDQIGICIDTSHETSGGIKLQTYAEVKEFFNQIKYPTYISLIHLNGTSFPLGSGKDCHEVIFSKNDLIWGKYKSRRSSHSKNIYNSGVAYIVKFCKKYKIPIILEVNREIDGDTHNALKRLRLIYKSF